MPDIGHAWPQTHVAQGVADARFAFDQFEDTTPSEEIGCIWGCIGSLTQGLSKCLLGDGDDAIDIRRLHHLRAQILPP
jgi:hypothetical protein